MLVQVPKGKRFYVGKFRFIEGEVIPPHLSIGLKDVEFPPDPVDDVDDVPELEHIEEEKPKRKYTRKPKPDATPAEAIPEEDTE